MVLRSCGRGVAQHSSVSSVDPHVRVGGLFPSILDPLAAAVNHKELPSGFLHTACSCVCQENEELSEDQKAQLRCACVLIWTTQLCRIMLAGMLAGIKWNITSPLTTSARTHGSLAFAFMNDFARQDLFLREHMERDGWVALDLIRTFPRVISPNFTCLSCRLWRTEPIDPVCMHSPVSPGFKVQRLKQEAHGGSSVLLTVVMPQQQNSFVIRRARSLRNWRLMTIKRRSGLSLRCTCVTVGKEMCGSLQAAQAGLRGLQMRTRGASGPTHPSATET